MKIPLCLLAAFCMLISSCQKEGPLGFKTGQEYEYTVRSLSSKVPDTVYIWEVIDVGKDWVEFENESGSSFRKTKASLEKYLSRYHLQ